MLLYAPDWVTAHILLLTATPPTFYWRRRRRKSRSARRRRSRSHGAPPPKMPSAQGSKINVLRHFWLAYSLQLRIVVLTTSGNTSATYRCLARITFWTGRRGMRLRRGYIPSKENFSLEVLHSGEFSYTVELSLTLSVPHCFWLWQKWVYQSVQRHTGITHPFNFLTFGHSGSGAQFWAPECPNLKKIKKGGLDQYGPEQFEVQPFYITGLERITSITHTLYIGVSIEGAWNYFQPRREIHPCLLWLHICDYTSSCVVMISTTRLLCYNN